jgi:hypothetical protein
MNNETKMAAKDVVVAHFEAKHLKLLLEKTSLDQIMIQNCNKIVAKRCGQIKNTKSHICPTG